MNLSIVAIGLASFTLGVALVIIQVLVWLVRRTSSASRIATLQESGHVRAHSRALSSIPLAMFSIQFWDIFLLLLGLSMLTTILLSMSKDLSLYLPGAIMSFICGLCAYVYRQ